ncbi:unnamed protein product [Litomosoides sigmodontis]|uniref:Uncharacterized protein n=1 Tax=Litomosoides sigmodontis TaxID=42156 RepID=A0A3P6SUQ5_LITSI|nr:unnamed protein product [Litomosoides sigmodontis]
MTKICGRNFFVQNIDRYITDEKCKKALANCTEHWDIIPLIPPLGLCDEYFSIECITELVVSSHCKDETGYGEFLTKIASVIEDCAKGGMRWTSIVLKQLIARALKHILCYKTQKQCFNTTMTSGSYQKRPCDIKFPACIMRTYREKYCREFENDLELAYYVCLSHATKCEKKGKMITECEKQYLVEVKRIVGEIDGWRYLATNKSEMKGKSDRLKFQSEN